jgi:hypothetical protein
MKNGQAKDDTSRPSEPTVDGRGEILSPLRAPVMEADPEMTEGRKWVKPSNPAGVPTFSYNGLVCTGETYKGVVKMTFRRPRRSRGARAAFGSGGADRSALHGRPDRRGARTRRGPRRSRPSAAGGPGPRDDGRTVAGSDSRGGPSARIADDSRQAGDNACRRWLSRPRPPTGLGRPRPVRTRMPTPRSCRAGAPSCRSSAAEASTRTSSDGPG